MSLLVPCTDQANCYVYTVRGPGPAPAGNGSSVADTLQGIATWFGVDINKVRQMNPGLGGSDTIHPGDKLKIPSPTR
jgi:LysM repeat protein